MILFEFYLVLENVFALSACKFNEQKLRWRMPNGGRVSFAYLEKVLDADQYQGRNVTDAWVEEAGQYPTPAPIDQTTALHSVRNGCVRTFISERARAAHSDRARAAPRRGRDPALRAAHGEYRLSDRTRAPPRLQAH